MSFISYFTNDSKSELCFGQIITMNESTRTITINQYKNQTCTDIEKITGILNETIHRYETYDNLQNLKSRFEQYQALGASVTMLLLQQSNNHPINTKYIMYQNLTLNKTNYSFGKPTSVSANKKTIHINKYNDNSFDDGNITLESFNIGQINIVKIFHEKSELIEYLKYLKSNSLIQPFLLIAQTHNGGSKEYIKLKKGGKRLIRYGSKGGRYYMRGGNKIYIK